MIDDKGNEVHKGDIVVDTGNAPKSWAYYYVIDKDHVIVTDKNAFLQTFDQLKDGGYIKIQTPHKEIAILSTEAELKLKGE